jgi:hypothetical protein
LGVVVEKYTANPTCLCLRYVKKGDYIDEAFRKTCPKHGLKPGE